MNKEQTKYWFKNKNVGIGWTPVTWQGWLTVFVYVVAMIGWGVMVFAEAEGVEEVKLFFVGVFAFVALLLVICVKKGEPFEWKFWKQNK